MTNRPKATTWALAITTVLILLYCLVAALNARAIYDPIQGTFSYAPSYIQWLPHSYDRARTYETLWNYLALALSFWAIHDWLREDVHQQFEDESGHRHRRLASPPARLRRLFWILAINGALLAFEGLIQRADGGAKLLWTRETHMNRSAIAQFGPYAYRSNAAQYFNLLWPPLLGFWWWLEQSTSRRSGRVGRYRVMLPLALLIAVCPIVSLSRAAAIVSVVTIAAAGIVLLLVTHGPLRRNAVIIAAVIVLVGGAAMYFNAGELTKRFATASKDLYEGREKTYEIARLIQKDYPIFGVGPGGFEHVFQLYRSQQEEYWPAQLHNDWLETAVTFGWVGGLLIGVAMSLVLVRWFLPGPLHVPWPFPAMFWISLTGCLIHARVDFPFQIYSIVFMALVLGAVLFSIARPPLRS
jgi:O-antigen ligase